MAVVVRGEVYAHVARGLIFDGRSLTLVDLAPSTMWAHASPAPELDYLTTGAFLDRWAERSPARRGGSRPVRGLLSLLDPDAELAGRPVLALSHPRVSERGLTYDAEIVEGVVPVASGACVLFLIPDPTASAGPSSTSSPGASPDRTAADARRARWTS